VYNAPAYNAPPPAAYNAPPAPPAPSYDAQPGYNAQPGYGGPSGGQGPGGYGQQEYGQGGYGQPGGGQPGGYPPPGGQPPGGYGPPPGQAPGGYPQNQYQPGTQGGFRQGSSSGGVPAVSFNMARLVLTDRIIGIATLITMISLFLTWFTASATSFGVTVSASASGTTAHGWLWLEFIVALAIIVYVAAVAAWDTLPFSLPVTQVRLLMGATGLQFLLILIGFLAKPSSSGISVSWSFGAFIALIASLVALAAAIPQVVAYANARLNRGQQQTPVGGPPRQY
jgi:hypothetical protein